MTDIKDYVELEQIYVKKGGNFEHLAPRIIDILLTHDLIKIIKDGFKTLHRVRKKPLGMYEVAYSLPSDAIPDYDFFEFNFIEGLTINDFSVIISLDRLIVSVNDPYSEDDAVGYAIYLDELAEYYNHIPELESLYAD